MITKPVPGAQRKHGAGLYPFEEEFNAILVKSIGPLPKAKKRTLLDEVLDVVVAVKGELGYDTGFLRVWLQELAETERRVREVLLRPALSPALVKALQEEAKLLRNKQDEIKLLCRDTGVPRGRGRPISSAAQHARALVAFYKHYTGRKASKSPTGYVHKFIKAAFMVFGVHDREGKPLTDSAIKELIRRV
jgi:hypothetical protein